MAITTSTSRETESPPVAERRFSVADPDPVSQTVYAALADAEGVEPSDLDFALHRSLDVDALDDFVRHVSSSGSGGHAASSESDGHAASDSEAPASSSSAAAQSEDSWAVSFAVAGYEVTVEGTGRVAVYETV